MACILLVPIELPGPWWRRHRHWLAAPVPLVGTRPTVVNARTGEAYPWTFRGNHRGRGWFGVRTRWARLHPAWKREPWVAIYDDPAPADAASRPASRRIASASRPPSTTRTLMAALPAPA